MVSLESIVARIKYLQNSKTRLTFALEHIKLRYLEHQTMRDNMQQPLLLSRFDKVLSDWNAFILKCEEKLTKTTEELERLLPKIKRRGDSNG